MALPKIATPTFELIIPSTKKKIKYRPFLVKEEKVLVLAMESEDIEQIARAIKDVLSACIITRGVKVNELSTFDIEYLFLNVRGKSVGESIDVIVTCQDDGETKVPLTIFIDEIKVVDYPEHKSDIKLDDTLTLRMKYPSLGEFITQNFGDGLDLQSSFDVIASCIDMIYSDEETWESKDTPKKEWVEFVEQLNSSQFKEIEHFFNTMPKLSHTVKYENPNTGVENEVVLEGLASFFS
tara:strand:+ start:5450 stop:6163 length:714 start_codon:yes stop_codon:yes gene_type:complete